MPAPFTTRTARGHLDQYHDTALMVIVVDAEGADAASPTMAYVSEIVGEIDAEDAPDYERGTADFIYYQDGESGILDLDPAGSTYVSDLTGANPAGVWLAENSLVEGEYPLIAFLPVEEGPGFPSWDLQSPADGRGVARVSAVTDELVASVIDAISEIDGGTP